MSAALAILLAAHLVTTMLVVHFLARTDTVTLRSLTAWQASHPGSVPTAQTNTALENHKALE